MMRAETKKWCNNCFFGERYLEGRTVVKTQKMGEYSRILLCECSDGTRVFIGGGEYSQFWHSDVFDSKIFTKEEKEEFKKLVDKHNAWVKRHKCMEEKRRYEELKKKYENKEC